MPSGLPLPGHGLAARETARRTEPLRREFTRPGAHDAVLDAGACLASVPGGSLHLVPFQPSQEKHSRLIMLEFLNIQKAVML